MATRFEVNETPRNSLSVTSRGRNTAVQMAVYTAVKAAPRLGPRDCGKAEGWAFPGPPLKSLAHRAARPLGRPCGRDCYVVI